jgi:hypothetical protein
MGVVTAKADSTLYLILASGSMKPLFSVIVSSPRLASLGSSTPLRNKFVSFHRFYMHTRSFGLFLARRASDSLEI